MKRRNSLLTSILALLLCVSMLLGTTFAWFTDSATSGNNLIQSGNLDIEMYWSDKLLAADSDEWQNADGTPIFTYDKWEPGYTEVRYIKVKNAGSLALQWRLFIEAEGAVGELAEVIEVYYVNPITSAADDLSDLTSVGVLTDVLNEHKHTSGILLPAGETSAVHTVGETILAVAFHMDENAGNKYQGKSVGDGFAVNLIATQYTYESDAFGDQYDELAQWPNNVTVSGHSASAAVTADADNKVASAVSFSSTNGKISASVPAGVKLANGANKLTLSVNSVADSEANITLDENEAALSLDVHIDGVAADNDVPMAVTMKGLLPKGLNMGNYEFYHVEDGQTVVMTLLADGATPVHNNFEYDPATGDVVLYLKSFSEFAFKANKKNAWKGERWYNWYKGWEEGEDYLIHTADELAGLSAIVGGMATAEGIAQDDFAGRTVKLMCNLNIGYGIEDHEYTYFYPIGYYNDEGTYEKSGIAVTSGFKEFKGTFDGNGNIITYIYQNTWDMKGDNNYYAATEQCYRDGMGLFGKVYGGTVKNLTVRNFESDGEYTTTGVIAAYADCGATFENIAIIDCNPRVYNIGNGGIVGCVGWYAKEAGKNPVTFRNITVDNTNKISALWGSWDVACGGLVGQYYPTSGQDSAIKNAGIHMDNCHVSAQIDVYNDVCANYQYYAYRYAGMLIGSVRENETVDGHVYPKVDGITATGCTVHFGDWNDYYYCELVANSLASYTHDHQMSRLEQVASVDVENKKVTTLKGDTIDIPTSGRVNYVVVKAKGDDGKWIHGDGHDYAECYHFVNGVQHFHNVADSDNPNPTETVNGQTVLKEDKQLIYREFNQLFTGYGWGVTSKGLTDFANTLIMDVEDNNQEESIKKFACKAGATDEYFISGKHTITIGSLFELAVPTENIDWDNLQVFISPEDGESGVRGTYTPDANNWKNGTITFDGNGDAIISITDFNYCVTTMFEIRVHDANSNSGGEGTGNPGGDFFD